MTFANVGNLLWMKLVTFSSIPINNDKQHMRYTIQAFQLLVKHTNSAFVPAHKCFANIVEVQFVSTVLMNMQQG